MEGEEVLKTCVSAERTTALISCPVTLANVGEDFARRGYA